MTEDIGLLDELLADSKPVHSGCTVCSWLKDRDDATEWDAAFSNERVTATAITRAMRKRGYPYKDKPVQIHRSEQHRVA